MAHDSDANEDNNTIKRLTEKSIFLKTMKGDQNNWSLGSVECRDESTSTYVE
jgi:hypothetical protein